MYGRTQSRSTGLFLTLCAAMVLLAMLSQQTWAAGARGAAKGVFTPLEAGMMVAAGQIDNVGRVFGDVSALRAENERLRAADAELRRQVLELSAAGQENTALRHALDFEKSSGHRMVAARVVGRGPDSFSRTVEIDRGTSEGIHAGMVVVSAAGLVGRVRETGPHASIVQTLSDPQSRVNVFLSRSRLQGTVAGGPTALQLQIEHRLGVIPANGEWAITSGVGGSYPRGLLVGEVASVDHRDSSSTDLAAVAWVNDSSSLSLILVVTDFTPS